MSGKLVVVVGGQYGSEAKGHVCGWLGEREFDLLGVRVGGSNAGHTLDGVALRQIPVAAIRLARYSTELAIAAGSEFDIDVVREELAKVAPDGWMPELAVDPEATWVDANHKAASRIVYEAGHPTGGTGKGVGAARRARLAKVADRVRDHVDEVHGLGRSVYVNDVASRIDYHLQQGHTVLIEGTQGYGLGQHAGYYPYVTSGDCRAIDFMAQAGVSPWAPEVGLLEVWVVFRSYPIRVAGNSGPMRRELTWDSIGVPAEQTTVTKKTRRVGSWDTDLARAAMQANGGAAAHIAYMHLDYDFPGLTGCEVVTEELLAAVVEVEQRYFPWLDGGQHIELVGTSPSTIVDLRGAFE